MRTTHDTTYLIDGSGYIFRAFYAIQRLSTKDGFPTNALYGFLRMMLKTMAEANSSRVAIIFDAGRKTFRNDLYPEYKANRAECPPELSEQMPYFRELSRALGLPVLECPGWEADDIIATLTSKLSAERMPVVIVSGDKDLMQLVTDNVHIWDTMKDAHYGPPQVTEKFGVGPEKVTEILALTGDSSDNVPGVDGVGPKTATQLVQKYGSVEGIIANVAALKEDAEIRNRKKIAESIESNVDRLRLALRLVEVARDVPLEKITDGAHDIQALLEKKETDAAHLAELFEKFEFQSLFKEFKGILNGGARATTLHSYEYQTILAPQFPSWCEQFRTQNEFSFDLETTSLDVHSADIVGISVCWNSTQSFYIPLAHRDLDHQVSWADFSAATRDRFSDAKVLKSGQNIKYDLSILELHGMQVRGVAFDSMVAAYLLNPDSRNFNLTALASDYLRLPVIEYEEVTAGKGNFAEVAIAQATQYACQDAHYAWLLKEQLAPRIEEASLTRVFSELEVPLIPVLARIERAGIKVDLDALRAMSAEFAAQLLTLEEQIYGQAGQKFNINSPKQLAEIFFSKLGISTKGVKKTKTGFSTDSSVLEKLAESHPLPALILEYRSLHKLKSTYTDALAEDISPKTGRVHTRLNQTLTGTGRLSSSDPNLQNIPVQSAEGRRIRSAFIPKEGHFFIAADYSQIELRLLAHLSEDDNLIRAFSEGHDIHSETAREIMGLSSDEDVTSEIRRIGKTINFGIVYGMGAFRLGRELGIPVSQASNYITSYFNRYPKVKEYFSRLEENALAQGEVQTIYGRKRVISSIDTSGRDQGFAMRAAINAPLQGSAADIIKLAMIRVDDLLNQSYPGAQLVLQIHDELLVEAPDRGDEHNQSLISAITQAMESVITLKVPLKVDAGSGFNWQQAQS
ncbi:MAG: DNA polymerase I [Pseudomonadota bacterium]|jgi:DNA polymerase-1